MKNAQFLKILLLASFLWYSFTTYSFAQSILIDASKDGGLWWSGDPHQGSALANYLRAQGMTVDELPQNTMITCDDLSNYDLVIAVGSQSEIRTSEELAAYVGFAANGGRLILLEDHSSASNLAQSLGLNFSGSFTSTITNFTYPHPITEGVLGLEYIAGSKVTQYPPSATLLGFLPMNLNGEPMMGIMEFSLGQVFFLGDVNGIQRVPQPFVDNLFTFMLDGAVPVDVCLPSMDDINLDVDGNNKANALTDGILIIRYLFGFRGEALCEEATADDATRTCVEIEAHIEEILP